jgi:hypothetical protein
VKYFKPTVVVLIVTAVALSLYDIWAAWHGGQAATISLVLTRISHSWPAIPFAVGFLCGHLFAQNRP